MKPKIQTIFSIHNLFVVYTEKVCPRPTN